MFTIDKTTKKPMYQQIIDSIINQIEQGSLRYNEMLPNEDQCQKIYGISSVIVKKAYKELRHLGYISRKQGSGTVVCYLPLLHICMDDLPDLNKVHSTVHPQLILKETIHTIPKKTLYKFVFQQDSLNIAVQEISTVLEVPSSHSSLYQKLISSRTQSEMKNMIAAKLADNSLSILLGINESDAVTMVENRSSEMTIKTFLRSDVIAIEADTYVNK